MFNGQNIKDIIIKKGLSQKDVFKKANVKEVTFYSLFKDSANPSSNILESLADVLECDIDDFFDRSYTYCKNVGHQVNGNGNKVSGDITLSECKNELEKLRLLLKEKEERIKDKDEMIALLKQQLNK